MARSISKAAVEGYVEGPVVGGGGAGCQWVGESDQD